MRFFENELPKRNDCFEDALLSLASWEIAPKSSLLARHFHGTTMQYVTQQSID